MEGRKVGKGGQEEKNERGRERDKGNHIGRWTTEIFRDKKDRQTYIYILYTERHVYKHKHRKTYVHKHKRWEFGERHIIQTERHTHIYIQKTYVETKRHTLRQKDIYTDKKTYKPIERDTKCKV